MPNRLLRATVVWLLMLVTPSVVTAGPAQRTLAAAVYRADTHAPGLSDAFAVALAEAGLSVVDREHLELLMAERALTGVARREAERSLGRMLGADRFVWIDVNNDGPARLGVIDMAGRQLADLAIGQAGEPIDAVMRRAVDQVVAMPATPPADADRPAVVVVRPTNAAPEVLGLMQRVIDGLPGRMTLLHRRLIEVVTDEQWLAEKGLAGAPSKLDALRHADVVVVGEWEAPRLRLALIDVASGGRLASQDWPIETDPAVITAWIADRSMQRPEPPPASNQGLSPELLDEMYDAMRLFWAGRYDEVIPAVARVRKRDPRLAEPLLWAARAFAQADMAEYEQGIHRALAEDAPAAKYRRLRTSRGVVFLGVSTNEAAQASLANVVALRLSDDLRRLGGLTPKTTRIPGTGTVLLAGDIARLRAEFDVSVGLERTAGTTWQRAPALLRNRTIIAHLTRHTADGRLQLWLNEHRGISPQARHQTITTRRPDEPLDAWVSRAVDRHYAFRQTDARNIHHPPLTPPEPDAIILNWYSKYRTDPGRLQAFRDNPSDLSLLQRSPGYGLEVNTSNARDQYYDRMVPRDSPARSAVEWYKLRPLFFRVDSSPQGQAVLAAYKAGLAAIAERWPTTDAGLQARYNLLLLNASHQPFETSLEQAEALLEDSGRALQAKSIQRLCDFLRVALGHPPAKPERLDVWVGSIGLHWQEPWRNLHGGTTPAQRHFNGLRPVDAEQARLNLLLLSHALFHNDGGLTVSHLRRHLQTHDASPGTVRHVMSWYTPETRDEPLDDLQWYLTQKTELIAWALDHQTPRVTLRLISQVAGTFRNASHQNEGIEPQRAAFRRMMLEAIGSRPEIAKGLWNPGSLQSIFGFRHVEGSADLQALLTRRALDEIKGDPFESFYWPGNGLWFSGPDAQLLEQWYFPYESILARKYAKLDGDDWPLRLHAYYEFGLTYVQCNAFRRAEPLLRELLSWQGEVERSGLPPFSYRTYFANAAYALAICRWHAGDHADALQAARQGLALMKERDLTVIRHLDLPGPSKGGHGSLKQALESLVHQLRHHPDQPFKNPLARNR